MIKKKEAQLISNKLAEADLSIVEAFVIKEVDVYIVLAYWSNGFL